MERGKTIRQVIHVHVKETVAQAINEAIVHDKVHAAVCD